MLCMPTCDKNVIKNKSYILSCSEGNHAASCVFTDITEIRRGHLFSDFSGTSPVSNIMQQSRSAVNNYELLPVHTHPQMLATDFVDIRKMLGHLLVTSC